MQSTRYLVPLNPLTVQWQLRAVLRLPPELRELAVRDFSQASRDDAEMRQPRVLRVKGGHNAVDMKSIRLGSETSGKGGMKNTQSEQDSSMLVMKSLSMGRRRAAVPEEKRAEELGYFEEFEEEPGTLGSLGASGANPVQRRDEKAVLEPKKIAGADPSPVKRPYLTLEDAIRWYLSLVPDTENVDTSKDALGRWAAQRARLRKWMGRRRAAMAEDEAARGKAIASLREFNTRIRPLEIRLLQSVDATETQQLMARLRDMDKGYLQRIGLDVEPAKVDQKKVNRAANGTEAANATHSDQAFRGKVEASTKEEHRRIGEQQLPTSQAVSPPAMSSTDTKIPSAPRVQPEAPPPEGSTNLSMEVQELRAQIADLTMLVQKLLPKSGGNSSSKASTPQGRRSHHSMKAVRNDASSEPPRDGQSNVRRMIATGEAPFSDLPMDVGHGKDNAEVSYQEPSSNQSPNAARDEAQNAADSSLYDELFPEEVAQSSPRSKSSVDDGAIPSLPLSKRERKERRALAAKSAAMRDGPKFVHNPNQRVLILRGASKALTEDDFRRAVPAGKHLASWRHRGEYEMVIPRRNFGTLEKTGEYYVIFKTKEKAEAFRSHVLNVHQLGMKHTPTSLLSELPPGPSSSLLEGSVDDAELVRNFTLADTSTSIGLWRATNFGIPKEMLASGGYPQMYPPGIPKNTPQVLLVMDGGVMPNRFQIGDAIARDGNTRGMAWKLIDGDLSIRKVDMNRSSSIDGEEAQPDPLANVGGVLNKAFAGDGVYEAQKQALEDIYGFSGDEDEFTFDQDAAAFDQAQRDWAPGNSAPENPIKADKNGQRWIIAFKEVEEAQRFARRWHKREFPWTDETFRRDKFFHGRCVVEAEMLW